jgi:hypothetical protein
VADCKAGSAATGSRGSGATDPGPLVPGKATDGPAAATTPVAGRGAIQIAGIFLNLLLEGAFAQIAEHAGRIAELR